MFWGAELFVLIKTGGHANELKWKYFIIQIVNVIVEIPIVLLLLSIGKNQKRIWFNYIKSNMFVDI